jgi:3-dehydroquinate synthase
MSVIPVATAQPYNVVVAAGARHEFAGLVADTVAKIAIIHAGPVTGLAHELAGQVTDREVLLLPAPEGERAKTADFLTKCWSALAKAGFTRTDLVVGVGGGATTDFAGFVAATWLRGVNFITVPTSVLGMVDAAVGGKTGINIPEGKNLVGAFHEPIGALRHRRARHASGC